MNTLTLPSSGGSPVRDAEAGWRMAEPPRVRGFARSRSRVQWPSWSSPRAREFTQAVHHRPHRPPVTIEGPIGYAEPDRTKTESTKSQPNMDHRTPEPLDRWREAELQRRLADEDEDHVERLRAPETFPAEYAPPRPDVPGRRGPESSTVDGVLTSGCCGWSRPPSAREFFEAMQADEPTKRQTAVGSAFVDEADIDEILMAHLEGAFTWRQLAALMHRLGRETSPLSTYLNRQPGEPRTESTPP